MRVAIYRCPVSFKIPLTIHTHWKTNGQTCRTLLEGTLVGDALLGQNEFFRWLPPKVKHQSLQNERFVQDTLQKSHVNSRKRACRTRHPPKSDAESLIGANTSSSPAKQFRNPSPSKPRSLTHQSQWHSDIHLQQTLHSRFASPATKMQLKQPCTLLTLTLSHLLPNLLLLLCRLQLQQLDVLKQLSLPPCKPLCLS